MAGLENAMNWELMGDLSLMGILEILEVFETDLERFGPSVLTAEAGTMGDWILRNHIDEFCARNHIPAVVTKRYYLSDGRCKLYVDLACTSGPRASTPPAKTATREGQDDDDRQCLAETLSDRLVNDIDGWVIWPYDVDLARPWAEAGYIRLQEVDWEEVDWEGDYCPDDDRPVWCAWRGPRWDEFVMEDEEDEVVS